MWEKLTRASPPLHSLIFNILNNANHTAAIELVDQKIITGEWQPEPPQTIPFWGSGHTPSGSMVIGAKAVQQGDTLVNSTMQYDRRCPTRPQAAER